MEVVTCEDKEACRDSWRVGGSVTCEGKGTPRPQPWAVACEGKVTPRRGWMESVLQLHKLSIAVEES